MLKKLSILCMVIFVSGLMIGGSAFAQSYGQDVLETGNPGGLITNGGLKTFDTVNPETLNPGNTFSIDIWAADITEAIISSGFEMFYDPAQATLVSVQAYDNVDITGYWDGTSTVKLPDAYGPGSYVLAVVQLGTCPTPDAGGDIIIAKVTFQCQANGTGNISVRGIDGFDTTVGCTSSVVYDATMGTNALAVTQGSVSTTTTSVVPTTTTTSVVPTTTTTSVVPTTTTTSVVPTTTTTIPSDQISYCQDFLETGNPGGVTTGLKTCDTVNPVTVSAGQTFSIDIWAANIPEAIISSGFEMFYDPAQVSLVSVQAYDNVDITGPWDGSATLKIPDPYGPGSYVLAVVQLGTCPVPDAGGDIIIAKVTFQCLAAGSGDISVQGIDSFDTTVGCTSSVVYDAQMGTSTLTVTQGASTTCAQDSECDDSNACTTDTCNLDTSTCEYAPVVCGDGDACTSDSCDPAQGCNYPPITCDDSDLCTDDSCDSLTGCVYTPKDCADADLCTDDICDQGTGECQNVPSCDDDNLCTTDSCDPGTGACTNTPVDCNDDNACTNDVCDFGTGECSNEPLDCNDDIGCTDDSCDSLTGCVNTPNDSICPDDGLYCNGTEFCDPELDCTSTGNPCPSEARVCIEATDECRVPACSISIDPTSRTVNPSESIQFNVVVSGTCDNEPSYTWEVSASEWTGCTGGAVGSAIGSTIDATGQYTAGTSEGMDYIRVTDYANGEICAFATATVIAQTTTTTTAIFPTTTTTTTIEPTTTTTTSIGPTTSTTTSIPGVEPTIDVRPASVFQSRWFFLPMWLRIEGTNTNFVRRESAVTFQPANALLKFPPLVLDSDTIVTWVVVMPLWLTGEIDAVDVTVTTGSESASDSLEIQLLPFFLEQQE